MEPNTVEMLERKLKEAIAEVIIKLGLKRLPLLPSDHTINMMPKASALVVELPASGPKATARQLDFPPRNSCRAGSKKIDETAGTG